MSADANDPIRFGFLLHDVSRLRRIVMDRALKPLGVTQSQRWVLAFLSRRDGMTQTELAADLDLSKVAVGGLLERMEAAGLVQRRSDDVDARIRRVYLTRQGTRTIERIRKRVEKLEHEILKSSSEKEIGVTFEALRRIKGTLQQMMNEEQEEGAEPVANAG